MKGYTTCPATSPVMVFHNKPCPSHELVEQLFRDHRTGKAEAEVRSEHPGPDVSTEQEERGTQRGEYREVGVRPAPRFTDLDIEAQRGQGLLR